MARYLLPFVVIALLVATPNGTFAQCVKQTDGSVVCQAPKAVSIDVPGVSVNVGPGVSVNVRWRDRPLASVDLRRHPVVRRWFRPRIQLRIGR